MFQTAFNPLTLKTDIHLPILHPLPRNPQAAFFTTPERNPP